MANARLSLALERIGPGDWEVFENFASEFLPVEYPALRTTAAPNGDKGRDAELFTIDGVPKVVFQYSVTASHIEQSRYVVIELKTGRFQPEYAGKLNFYVALVDDTLRRDHHNETIGILICGAKNDRSVRYSLGRSTSPMAVSAYTYDNLPPAEQQALPDEGHIVAALDWTGPDTDADTGDA